MGKNGKAAGQGDHGQTPLINPLSNGRKSAHVDSRNFTPEHSSPQTTDPPGNLSLIVALAFPPETKNRTLDEITQTLGKRRQSAGGT